MYLYITYFLLKIMLKPVLLLNINLRSDLPSNVNKKKKKILALLIIKQCS